MIAKVSVSGDDKHELFNYLTEDSDIPGEIKWNFSKFLLDQKGSLIERYESGVAPDDADLMSKNDELLASK